MKLATFVEAVDPPSVLPTPARMAAFVMSLRELGYDTAGCARRLRVFPRLGVNFWEAMRPQWAPASGDAVGWLIRLFIDSVAVPVDTLHALVPVSLIDDAIEARLLVLDGDMLRPKLSLMPCDGMYFVTDRAAKNTAFNQVMWLWGESYLLAGLVRRTSRRCAFDVGTGSGIHALLASRHCDRVVGLDVSPRALEFARFNAALNGVHNAEFRLSDLLDGVDGSCDLLVTNVPYAPDLAARAGDNFWSGGIDGMELLRRIVRAIPERVDADGGVYINSLFPLAPGSTLRGNFAQWLGGRFDDLQTLDHTWPVPFYEDLLSDAPIDADKSAWRFGVVSLRRAPHGQAGWWRELGQDRFFNADGSCRAAVDHDAT